MVPFYSVRFYHHGYLLRFHFRCLEPPCPGSHLHLPPQHPNRPSGPPTAGTLGDTGIIFLGITTDEWFNALCCLSN